jgi:hypothetical protein
MIPLLCMQRVVEPASNFFNVFINLLTYRYSSYESTEPTQGEEPYRLLDDIDFVIACGQYNFPHGRATHN